jgi:hypothetical protein
MGCRTLTPDHQYYLSNRAVSAYGADQEAVMFYPRNPEHDRDRSANAEITHAQLGIQIARLRESVRHWCRWFTQRKPAER